MNVAIGPLKVFAANSSTPLTVSMEGTILLAAERICDAARQRAEGSLTDDELSAVVLGRILEACDAVVHEYDTT